MQIKNSRDFWAGLMFIAIGLFFLIWADRHYNMGTAVRMGPAYFPAVLGGLLASLGAVIFVRGFFSSLPGGAGARIPFSVTELAIGVGSIVVAAWASGALFGSVQYGIMAAAFVLAVLANRFRLQRSSVPLGIPFNVADLVIAIAICYVAIQVSLRLWGNSDPGMLAAAAILSVLAALFRPGAKPLVLIFAGTIVYGYLMKPLGLFIATFATVFISALGGHEFRWKEVVILGALLAAFSYLVFAKGLTLPFPLCPDFIERCPIR